MVALVANDLARLHRKGWRVGDLIEKLERHGVVLVLAAPNRQVDTSTPMGKIFIQFAAIFDEYYAEDISQRAKDSIQYRKARGISVGKPPFGTVRGKDGFLQPSSEGAWLLPNGRFAAGSADECPEEGAVWRGYYECARYVLDLYAEHDMGYEKIAYRLNEEGWPFCDRQGEPRPIDREDVRRVLGAWPEYGGAVLDEKAKDRRAYEDLNVEDVPLREDRAVFPLDLLRKVGPIRNSRSRKPVDHGVNRETFPYPLNNITFCAHCLKLAEEQDDPRLKSTLGGINMNGTRRYRHKAGVSCGVTNRSVPCDDYEADVGRLLRLLEITPEALEYMTELAIQADLQHKPDQGDVDPEREKQEAIALCNRRIDAAVTLYKEGRIDIDEYHDIVTRNEREIAHWQMRTSEMEQIAVELAMCMDVVNKVADLWDTASPEDRQGMA
ncbi:MAG: recombinase family protein, partial [Anaerolineae bacterium]|nr:recombinase family protein [Anaerolineae bacterium]